LLQACCYCFCEFVIVVEGVVVIVIIGIDVVVAEEGAIVITEQGPIWRACCIFCPILTWFRGIIRGEGRACDLGVFGDVRTETAEYVVKLPAFMTLSTNGCFCATVKGTFPLAVSTQLYMRMYPSVPPLKTHRISGVAVTALIDVLCGAAMVGTRRLMCRRTW
ncbi:hypothetical protein KCU65_g297, partial [Aureobasidium melanogenum]